MIKENLRTNVAELIKEVKVNERSITGVELVFNGDGFDLCINYHGINFIRPSEMEVVDITEEVKYTVANDDVNYLVAVIEREIEDILFIIEEVEEV